MASACRLVLADVLGATVGAGGAVLNPVIGGVRDGRKLVIWRSKVFRVVSVVVIRYMDVD